MVDKLRFFAGAARNMEGRPRASTSRASPRSSAASRSASPRRSPHGTTPLGPLNSQRQRERVEGFLERRPSHAEVVAGGEEPDLPGFFLEPTVVANLEQDDEMIQNEIFGPVITVQPFDDEDRAIVWGNGTKYGLAASVWDARRRSGASGGERAAIWLRVDQRPHPARRRDAARRLQAVGVRQGPLDVPSVEDYSMYSLEDYTNIKHVMLNTS